MKKKQYSGDFGEYEQKLRRIMERLGISENQYDYNWTRSDCYIEFYYKGKFYKFEHSFEKSKLSGNPLQCVSDLFAQLVITLEDIARMAARRIYDLSSFIEGMTALPPKNEIPSCFITLGFQNIPNVEELKKRYKELVKIAHPDTGGDTDMFKAYTEAYRDAEGYLQEI